MKKLILICLTLCACGLNRTSTPSMFYTITVPNVQQVRGPQKPVNVVLENVSVPQSVDRPQIVIKQTDSNIVHVSEFDRWIENLGPALGGAVVENMNKYAKNINARVVRNASNVPNVNYIVSIDFVRFETEANANITVSAWWTVSNARGEILVQKKTTLTAETPEYSGETPDYDAIVATQSDLVARLAYKIADTISELK